MVVLRNCPFLLKEESMESLFICSSILQGFFYLAFVNSAFQTRCSELVSTVFIQLLISSTLMGLSHTP